MLQVLGDSLYASSSRSINGSHRGSAEAACDRLSHSIPGRLSGAQVRSSWYVDYLTISKGMSFPTGFEIRLFRLCVAGA